ncbi:MAG: hypothetical protein IKE77_10150, partial [Erysipelotrichaceae bacterium]|nr:hypothetical protein [Erysipelotrichaceae bacterium]
MCIIAIKPRGLKMIPEKYIDEMFQRNRDGAGVMYLKSDGKVHIEKGFFSVDDLKNYLRENESVFVSTDVILHFRIGTSGKTDEVTCHPYSVWSENRSSCDVELAVAHNGILDNYGWKGTSEINDTQVFIRDLRKLPHNFLKNSMIITLLKKSVGSNRFAFLDRDGIHTIGNFIEEGGYYFSNESYKPYEWSYPSQKTHVKQTTLFDQEEFEEKLREGYEFYLNHTWGNVKTGTMSFSPKKYDEILS